MISIHEKQVLIETTKYFFRYPFVQFSTFNSTLYLYFKDKRRKYLPINMY